MNKKIITGIALCGMVAGLAQGATIRFKSSGTWDQTTNSTVNARGWQTTGALPGSLDTVRANWGGDVGNVVTLDFAAPTVNNFQLGVGESGEFHIQNGGVLTTISNSTIGNNGATALRKGILNIDAGGTVNVGGWLGLGYGTTGSATVSGALNANSHLWMGSQGGGLSVGTLTIENGGVVTVDGQLGMGTIDASNASGGTATITINGGGLLDLDHWSATGSIQDGSYIDVLESGTLVIGGNRAGEVAAYAAAGKILFDGASSGVVGVDYTVTEIGGTTTVTAIPEPATIGLVALFGGAMMFIRRRFKM